LIDQNGPPLCTTKLFLKAKSNDKTILQQVRSAPISAPIGSIPPVFRSFRSLRDVKNVCALSAKVATNARTLVCTRARCIVHVNAAVIGFVLVARRAKCVRRGVAYGAQSQIASWASKSHPTTYREQFGKFLRSSTGAAASPVLDAKPPQRFSAPHNGSCTTFFVAAVCASVGVHPSALSQPCAPV